MVSPLGPEPSLVLLHKDFNHIEDTLQRLAKELVSDRRRCIDVAAGVVPRCQCRYQNCTKRPGDREPDLQPRNRMNTLRSSRRADRPGPGTTEDRDVPDPAGRRGI